MECSMEESAPDPRVVARFFFKHRKHTGHEVVWSDVELPASVAPGRCYEARCLTCLSRHREPTRIAAQEWADEHEQFTDHAPDEVREVDLEVLSEEAVNRLIGVLESPFDNGVPRSLVVNVLGDHEGVSEADAENALQELLIAGTCFEPADGRIRAV